MSMPPVSLALELTQRLAHNDPEVPSGVSLWRGEMNCSEGSTIQLADKFSPPSSSVVKDVYHLHIGTIAIRLSVQPWPSQPMGSTGQRNYPSFGMGCRSDPPLHTNSTVP